MKKIFKYDGVEYDNENQVRKVVWYKERKALPLLKTAEDWAKHDVVYTEVEVQLTQEQMARQVRFQRDRLLSACDYYVMPDYPSTEQGLVEVKEYRQVLRDITKQEGFPTMVVWPVKPSVLG